MTKNASAVEEFIRDDKERKALAEIEAADRALRVAAMKLAAARGEPLQIDKHDQAALNANVDAIREGYAIVVDLSKPKMTLAANEISRDRMNNLTPAEMAKIASGELVVR